MEGDFISLEVERLSQIPRDYDVVLTQISLENNPRGVVSQAILFPELNEDLLGFYKQLHFA